MPDFVLQPGAADTLRRMANVWKKALPIHRYKMCGYGKASLIAY
jgi:hypothetical protein